MSKNNIIQEIEGDLIKLALSGEFDVIAHGCNCFCTMGAGIAPQMAKTFGCDKFPQEHSMAKGKINKLGTVDFKAVRRAHFGEENFSRSTDNQIYVDYYEESEKILYVVNAYTQYGLGANHKEGTKTPLDYTALRMCMRKINHIFKGKHIGLPLLGCGLAGGSWQLVKQIIHNELKDMRITIVHFKESKDGTLESSSTSS